jgi:hypothetical protein
MDRWDSFIRKKLELNTKSHFEYGVRRPGVGGRSISSELAPADRPQCHSGIFFSWAKIFKPIWHFRPTGLDDFAMTRFAWQQNRNELSVLSVFGRVGKLVVLALLMMRLSFEALFFRGHLVQ